MLTSLESKLQFRLVYKCTRKFSSVHHGAIVLDDFTKETGGGRICLCSVLFTKQIQVSKNGPIKSNGCASPGV